VEPVAEVLAKELLAYQYSRAVRKDATKIIIFLLNACQDSNQMTTLFNHLYPALKARIENRLDKLDFGELRFLTKELQRCVKQFWNFGEAPGKIFLPIEEAQGLVKLISEVAKEVREDREIRLEQFKTAKKKMDEEDIEYFYEDVKKVDKIENHVMEISGAIAFVYKQNVS
jgi:hypothetical protein